MKSFWLAIRLCSLIGLVVALASVGWAQNREKFVISAKAGGINSVTGRVLVTRAGHEPQLLTAQDDLAAGDRVTTGVGSRTEILLNPGSYLRVSEDSEFELVDNSVEDLRVKLIKGSAIIEATGTDDTQLRISVATDQERLVIVRRGIYRINVQPGSTELLVRKGRVLLGDNPREIAKGRTRVTFKSGSAFPFPAKLDKHDQDEFDLWSKQRAETLARANEKLSARALNGYFSSNDWGWRFGGLGRWGLWTYSASFGCYTFLPFYFGWASPYGRYYGLYYSIFDYFPGRECCGGVVREPVIVSNPSGPGNPVLSQPPSRPPVRDPDTGERAIRKSRDP